MREPSSIIYFKVGVERKGKNKHETPKPLGLFRYLIKTYSNEGNIVYDGFMGSGTTAIAAMEENRQWIGFELDPDYYKAASKRIENHKAQLKLF